MSNLKLALVLSCILAFGANALADDHHFGDPGFEDHHFTADTTKWADAWNHPGDPQSSSDHHDHTYEADSSAFVRAPFNGVVAAALDYDHYKQMGMPHVNDCHVVSRNSPGDILDIWSWMSYFGQDSKHYLEVFVRRGLPNGAVGLAWHQVQRQASWPYDESTAFSRLDGTFYILPSSNGMVYVRYFLSADLLPSADPWYAPGGIIENTFRGGVEDVIRTVARVAGGQ